MKVTALIPDEIVRELQELTGERTITGSLLRAVREWIQLQRVKALNAQIAERPLQLEGADARRIRELSRRNG